MNRNKIINIIGPDYLTSNIETGEWSYVKAAGNKETLEKLVGHKISHFKLDIRFEDKDFLILVETKQEFEDSDAEQLAEYLEEERALNKNKKIICILANTNNDKIRVYKSFVDSTHILEDETVIDTIEHYKKLFDANKQNNREEVLKNTYSLNELLHKMDINEELRSQFVGTTLLYIKKMIAKKGSTTINQELVNELNKVWELMSSDEIRTAIKTTLDDLLDGSENKSKKIELLQKNILNDQHVKSLTLNNWIKIFDTIILDIYKYIDTESSEGQDILNLFFIAFNKYTGKADKNQAFTPDHITEFMCRLTNVDRTKVVLDATCGSGSFLVQAMVKELADCRRGKTEKETKDLMEKVKKEHIFGIEIEEKAYGLATTNMLIHGDGNSNIKFANMFDCKNFIKDASPDIILMNPPYNAKPKGIPENYKTSWTSEQKNGKTDPTKGFVFLKFISDCIKEMNDEREQNGKQIKEVKCAILLPVAIAIGTGKLFEKMKEEILENNTLDAVFSLPNEIFYPGASASACCMLFTLGKPHKNQDETINETFFGYYKEDGFKKKKNLGRVEQFNEIGDSKWKEIENEWLSLFRNKKIKDGKSSTAIVGKNDEWLCEAYMKTDYTTLTEKDFQQTLNDYLAYLVKEGHIYESKHK